MHILHCYKTALPLTKGGVEQFMHHISLGLVERGHQSTILAFAPEKEVREINHNGYKIVVVPSTKEIASTPLSLKGFAYYKKLCDTADVIHYQYPFPLADLMHLVHPHNKPCVMSYHSDIVKQKYLGMMYKPLQDFFLKRMDVIVATSPQYIETSNILKKHSDKVTCIPLGLDEKNYLDISSIKCEAWKHKLPERFLLFVGVFRYYKGLNYLIKALEGLDYPVVLIGDGPEREHIETLKRELKLKNLILLGSLEDEDKNAILKLSSGLILPSHVRSEAFGLALLEGCMFAKPLISCEIGTGTTFINQDKKTGWVAKPGDIDSLRNILKEWYGSSDLSYQYGQAARKRYEEYFRADVMVSSYLKLYNNLV